MPPPSPPQSITRNWSKLIYSVVFSFIIIVAFATPAFFTEEFRGHYSLGDHMDARSLLGFVATHLDYGMREARQRTAAPRAADGGA